MSTTKLHDLHNLRRIDLMALAFLTDKVQDKFNNYGANEWLNDLTRDGLIALLLSDTGR
jgi:hypothetical protein